MDLDELRIKNALRCTLLSYSKNAGATLDLLRGLHCRWGGGFVAWLIALPYVGVPMGRQSRVLSLTCLRGAMRHTAGFLGLTNGVSMEWIVMEQNAFA